jgi:hypothetical protein
LGEFLGFLLIISVIGWGTAFTALHFRRHLKRMDEGVDHEVLARILEDVDQISTRLSRLEEDMDFFKELRAPDTPGRLPEAPGRLPEPPASEEDVPRLDHD